MTAPAEKRRHSVEDYLRIERDSLDKHEFHDGEILAMSGGSPMHSLIASNVMRQIGNSLANKRCRVFESNLRLRIGNQPRYVYADGSVICGPLQFDPADSKRETVTNPKLVVEVLSPSTELYDRSRKFDLYRQIPSLEEYVLVAQDAPLVEVYTREPDGTWIFWPHAGLEATAKLRSIDVLLALSEIYDGVEFPPEAGESLNPSPS